MPRKNRVNGGYEAPDTDVLEKINIRHSTKDKEGYRVISYKIEAHFPPKPIHGNPLINKPTTPTQNAA